MSVPAVTINKVCLSGLNAVALADQLIERGVRCGRCRRHGVDDPGSAPAAALTVGFKYGDVTMIDHMAYDGLWDAFTDQAMGSLTDDSNRGEQLVSREDQDAFAARSHQRAAAATASGVMAEEIVEVRIPQRRGDDVVIIKDEGIRDGVTAESLPNCRQRSGATARSPRARPARSQTARRPWLWRARKRPIGWDSPHSQKLVRMRASRARTPHSSFSQQTRSTLR